MRHNPSSHAVKSTVCSKLPPPLHTLVRNLSNWSERKVCLGGQCYELTVTFITCQEWALWKRFPWIQSVNSSAKTSYVQHFHLLVSSLCSDHVGWWWGFPECSSRHLSEASSSVRSIQTQFAMDERTETTRCVSAEEKTLLLKGTLFNKALSWPGMKVTAKT